MSNTDHAISGEEIKKEFQLERMILFSDAVFAIVITLMAIEIKIPETEERLSNESLLHGLRQLAPVILAYIVSFFFIGNIWYRHLKIFSIVKDYDGGLVVRNLLLLFFIGLFPFSASILTRSHSNSFGFFIYFGVILLCMITQFLLQHYIVVQRPGLRINTDMKKPRHDLQKRKILVIGFSLAFLLAALSFGLISDPANKSLASLWVVPAVLAYRILIKKLR